MWAAKKELPAGGRPRSTPGSATTASDRYTENRDDQGGWAPREKITEALQDLGLLPAVVVVGGEKK